MDDDPGSARRPASQAWGSLGVAAIALASGAELWRATRFGIDLSHDSTYYLGGAQSLRLGHGFNLRPGAVIVWHAPGYSFVLAALGAVHHNLLVDARWLNAGLLVTTIALAAVLLRRAGATWPATLVTTAALALSQPVLRDASFAWSENLFVPFVIGGAIALAAFRSTGRRRSLALAGLAFGGAALARYSGFPLVAAAAVLVVAGPSRPWRARLTDLVIVGVTAGGPPAAWLIRNRIQAGTFTGRHVSYALPPGGTLTRGVRTTAGWILPPAGRAGLVWASAVAAAAVVIALVAVLRRRRNPETTVTAVLLVAYVVGFGLSRVLVDHRIPFDGRILLPAHVLIVVLIGLALPRLELGPRLGPWVVAGICLVAIAADGQQWANAHLRHVQAVQRQEGPLALPSPP